MIYRLRFCNKEGIEARVDIQKGLSTPVIDVEGTNNPFTLSYNNDKGNKSGMFLTSSADIEIYETADFNIDNLKTSNETELAVTYYINNIVKWKGFIIPDFFSIEVRSNPVIVMTASDRLGTLKSVTLSDLPTMVNIRELAVLCLNKTGLELPLKTMADFSNDDTDNAFFSYYIDSQRIKDVKGRSISCYNILSSILIVSRSKLVQRAGEWVIINKLQHEIGSGKIYSSLSSFINYLENIYNFEEVSIGARRTIMPVAGSVGIYHEHGGRKSHPENYDFSLDLSGWNSVNGFVATIENRHITGFLGGTPFFDPERTVKQYLLNYNNWIDNTNNLNTAPYISTDAIPINSTRADRVEVTVDISSTMAEKLSSNTAISFLRYAVILTNGVKTYTLTKAGIFEILDPENISGHSLLLRGGQQHPLILASPAFSNSDSFKGLFEVGEDDDVNNYSATIRVYGSGDQYVTVNYALIKFSDVSELPKGTMYKTEQGNVFTKAYDIETSIFGDYLLSGLDGYFYRYPNDDTSSIYKDVNTLSTPVWTTPSIPDETSELPLLHHSMRQMRRMFSVAHDLLSAEIEVSDFDPLAIFVACEKRYTVVSAQFDFFKSNLSVELEEVAFQNNFIREYIYSYFGEGDGNIKNIGGISAGVSGGGTGGGLTPEQLEILSFWKKDPVNPNTIFTEMNAYSMGELSAYGIGSGGSSGGGVDLLQAWTDYDSSKDNWAVKAGLLVPFYNDTRSRLTALEAGGGGSDLTVNTTGTGNAITSISKAGTVITANKDLTFLETSIFNTHNTDNVRHITGAERTKWDGVVTDFAGLEIGGRNYFSIKEAKLVQNVGGYKTVTIQLLPNTQYIASTSVPEISPTTFNIFADKNPILRSSAANGLAINKPKLITTDSTGKIDVSALDSFIDNIINGTYYFQIEKANKPSDWSPAPEDQVSDWLTTDVNSFSFIKNKPTTLSGYGITDAVTLNTAQTITGAKTFSSNLYTTADLTADTGITIAQNGGTGVGLSLFGVAGTNRSTNPDFGLMFARTANKGTHGSVTGDWATYFTMTDTAGRGWIFTTDPVGTTGNVASISNTGNITASGEITAYIASDRRLKHNITTLFSSLDIIDKLNPVSYYWNAKAKELNPMKSDSLDYGLIAQEVENVLPGVVHGIFDDKYKSIDYIKLIPIMIAAIKELKQKMNKL